MALVQHGGAVLARHRQPEGGITLAHLPNQSEAVHADLVQLHVFGSSVGRDTGRPGGAVCTEEFASDREDDIVQPQIKDHTLVRRNGLTIVLQRGQVGIILHEWCKGRGQA